MVPNTPPPPSNKEKDPRQVDGEARKGDPRFGRFGSSTLLSAPDASNAKQSDENGWISVGDRLPDNGVMVMCWSKTNDDYEFGFVEKDGAWDLCGSGWASKQSITHWQPLPNPPKNP